MNIVMTLQVYAKMLYYVWAYDFLTQSYPLNISVKSYGNNIMIYKYSLTIYSTMYMWQTQ